MTATGPNTAVVPMAIGPMYSAGDPSTIPDGMTRSLRNYMIRPNRFDGRPPFVYDSANLVQDLYRWEDLTNQLTKTLAIDSLGRQYLKPTSGTGWGAATAASFPTGRMTDFANLLGKVYAMYDSGSTTVPTSASVYDGTNISTTPFNTPIAARTITSFIDRLFLAFPRVSVTDRLNRTGYDISTGAWSRTNLNATVTVASGKTICRVYPTNTTDANYNYQGILLDSASADGLPKQWRQDLRNTSSIYSVPFTMQMEVTSQIGINTAVVVGDLRADPGFPTTHTLFVCRVAGTTAAVTPVYTATVGADTVDGTSTWRCIGSAVFGTCEDFVPADTQNWYTFYCDGRLPASTNALQWDIIFRYGNRALATYDLTALDVGLKDGAADGNPVKQNYGAQLTDGDFYFPFFNQESSATATVNLDSIIWSEIDQPKQILAKNDFSLVEVAGLPTAATVIGGRYLVFKRRGLWVFKRTTDKNSPILPERPANVEVGCIGPRALDTYADSVYFIGENSIYRMTADGEPEDICGEGMREEIMAKGASWVESQSTYNVPFLVIEHRNKEAWVYTQKGKIYVYHIPSGGWSYLDVSYASTVEVRSMLYDYSGNRMLVSFASASSDMSVCRFDETSTAKDTPDFTGTTYSITNDIIFKPLELFAPRYEAYLEDIGIFHLATASQAGQTVTPSYSLDRGATFTTPSGYPATVDTTSPRVPLPVGTLGPSVTVKLSRVGSGGATNWSISKADAKLKVLRGELPYKNAT